MTCTGSEETRCRELMAEQWELLSDYIEKYGLTEKARIYFAKASIGSQAGLALEGERYTQKSVPPDQAEA